MKSEIEKLANKLVNAFVNNKIIAPLPTKFTKKLSEAQKLRKLCESKVKDPIIGFKAAGTGMPVMKKLKEKKPFYASIFKKNFIKSGKIGKINKSTIGI
jgi:2-keto-4-pentenoate hydratase